MYKTPAELYELDTLLAPSQADRAPVTDARRDDLDDEALATVMRNLKTTAIVEGSGRRDVPELPRVALREALANAVLHREYSPQFVGQAVSVEIYPDRVEVLSPGGLWGGKTLDNIADGISRCRNATMMQFMEAIPVDSQMGAPVEGQGSGISLMEHELASRGLPLPEYEAGFDYFRVTFRRGRDADFAKGREGDGRDDARPRPHAQGSVRRREPEFGPELSEVLALYAHDPEAELSSREVAEALGISLQAARLRLRRLVGADKLVPTAPSTSRSRRYALAEMP